MLKSRGRMRAPTARGWSHGAGWSVLGGESADGRGVGFPAMDCFIFDGYSSGFFKYNADFKKHYIVAELQKVSF